jgi:hypothetical protein
MADRVLALRYSVRNLSRPNRHSDVFGTIASKFIASNESAVPDAQSAMEMLIQQWPAEQLWCAEPSDGGTPQ